MPNPEESDFIPVTQPWMHRLSCMQQGVLMAAIRGPDGITKNHVSKLLLRWFRRCVLMCAFDHRAFERPFDYIKRRGGGFTGPSLGPLGHSMDLPLKCRKPLASEDILPLPAPDPHHHTFTEKELLEHWEVIWPREMHSLLDEYLLTLDELPHHFQLHFMHAAEILGYQHHLPEVRQWWHECYLRLVNDMHLRPETEDEMNRRLGDNEKEWRAKAEVTAF